MEGGARRRIRGGQILLLHPKAEELAMVGSGFEVLLPGGREKDRGYMRVLQLKHYVL